MTSARPRSARAASAAVLALSLLLAIAAAPGTASAATTKPLLSLAVIMPDFMCVTCHEPLNVAQSPQAISERQELSLLIAQGDTLSQIENAMVGQYGPTVLGVPKAQGFNLTVYILPPALLLAGIASLVVILPRWRGRARAAAAEAAPVGPVPDSAESRRLDEELARYQG